LKGFTFYVLDNQIATDSHMENCSTSLQTPHFYLRNIRLEELMQKHRPISYVVTQEIELPRGSGVRPLSSLDMPTEHLIILRYL